MTFAEELKSIYDNYKFMGMIKAELSHIKDEMKKAAMDGNSSFSIELIKPKYGDYGIGGVPSNYKVIVIDDKYYIDRCQKGVIEYLESELGFKPAQISTRDYGNSYYVSRTITVSW